MRRRSHTHTHTHTQTHTHTHINARTNTPTHILSIPTPDINLHHQDDMGMFRFPCKGKRSVYRLLSVSSTHTHTHSLWTLPQPPTTMPLQLLQSLHFSVSLSPSG